MKRLLILLATFTPLSLGLATHAQTPAAPLDAVKMTASGVSRSIDCGGRDLTVTGDNDKLTVTGCATISVVGNHNLMTAQLLPASTIAALGNSNHIVFLHAPGFEVQVSSSGSNNEIVPQMARDANDRSPVKFPITPH